MFKLCTAISLLILAFSCKTYHPANGLRDSFKNKGKSSLEPMPTTGTKDDVPKEAVDLGPENALIIKRLNLPSEVGMFNRTCLIIQTATKAEQVIKSYKLEDPIEIEPTLDYKVTVEVYNNKDLRYSNVYCNINQDFNAEAGRNIFTVSVCPPEGSEIKASPSCSDS